MINQNILDAFNISTKGTPLTGGQGTAIRYGDLVIKPIEVPAYYEQVSEIFNQLDPKHYRISRPVKCSTGKYVYSGFGATCFEPGEDKDDRIAEKLLVSNALHQDLAALFVKTLPVSHDPWTRAHQVLWHGGQLPEHISFEMRSFLEELLSKLPTHKEPLQLIHSDLGGNIMFHDSLPPLVIDFSPAMAPKKFADAIIVCDSIAWADQPTDALVLLKPLDDYHAMIKYAIAFRVLTIAFFEQYDFRRLQTEWEAYKVIWDIV